MTLTKRQTARVLSAGRRTLSLLRSITTFESESCVCLCVVCVSERSYELCLFAALLVKQRLLLPLFEHSLFVSRTHKDSLRRSFENITYMSLIMGKSPFCGSRESKIRSAEVNPQSRRSLSFHLTSPRSTTRFLLNFHCLCCFLSLFSSFSILPDGM